MLPVYPVFRNTKTIKLHKPTKFTTYYVMSCHTKGREREGGGETIKLEFMHFVIISFKKQIMAQK